MTQATGSQSFFEALVELNPGGLPGAWTDISGWDCAVADSGGDRQMGEVYTTDGDTAIIGQGKRQPRDITVRAVYTEQATDPYALALAAYRNHTVLQVRWSPLGGDTGEKRYTTNSTYSFVINCPPPVGEAGSGDPTVFEFTVHTSDVTQDSETT